MVKALGATVTRRRGGDAFDTFDRTTCDVPTSASLMPDLYEATPLCLVGL
jgi:hypothetical protein